MGYSEVIPAAAAAALSSLAAAATGKAVNVKKGQFLAPHDMKNVIDDAMLDTFSPSGTYAEIADILAEWYRDLTDWILFPIPDDPARDPDAAKVLDRLRSGT